MERLRHWIRRRAVRQANRLAIEEALLADRFARYARRRLTPFLASRGLRMAAHLAELTILVSIFAQKRMFTSLALINGAALVDAFWWGALEVMRRRVRDEPSKLLAALEVSRWMTRALWLAILALAVPIGITVKHAVAAAAPPSLLEVYALGVALRVAADLVTRTLYSGLYARQRVFRPLVAIILGEPVALLSIVVLWHWVGAWSLPAGLLVTVAVTRGITLRYTLRGYRVSRVPLPRVRLWPPRADRRPRVRDGAGAIVWAGLANLSTRLGSILVLIALARPLVVDDVLDPFAYVVHLAAPMLAGAGGWTQVFYHDFKRLEDEACLLMRRRLERRLGFTALCVAMILWTLSAGAALLFAPLAAIWRPLVAVLPLFGVLSYLAALQMRELARGEFLRLSLSAAWILFAFTNAAVFARHADATTLSLIAGGTFAGAIALLWWRGTLRPPIATGLQSTLLGWAHALSSVKGPVVVAWAQAGEASARARLTVARRVAALLGDRGAIVLLSPSGRLVWFERAPASLGPGELARVGAGKLARSRRLGPFEAGAAALAAAIDAGALVRPAATDADASLAALADSFRRRFPSGFVVDLAGTPTRELAALPAPERQSIWRDALRDARRIARARSRTSPFVVTSFRPGGTIRLLFIATRDSAVAERLAWRQQLDEANWRACGVVGERSQP